MNLTDLLNGLSDEPVSLEKDFEIKGIALDSRKIEQGFVFIAVAGAIQHGLVYAKQAVEKGAAAIVYDPQGSEGLLIDQINSYQLAVSGLGLKLGQIADRFYQSPSRALNVIGITGTNGKTTCSQFLSQLLPECGVIGTLGWGARNELQQTLNTTPDALAVQEILKAFVDLRKQTVVMEVSSHGLQQGRINQVCFKGAVFTNLSRDHLDYHGSMDAYLKAKLSLFKQPGLQFVVVNADDPNSERFLAVTNNRVKRWAFSASGNKIKSVANVVAEQINFSLKGIRFLVRNEREKALVETNIVGGFNLENILAVITVLLAQGSSLQVAADKVNKLLPVTGRMEVFGGHEDPFIFVDYAHTPDALEKVLKGLKKDCKKTLWLVFGCGGNRDKGKRAQMGTIAELNADQVIITDDNPRFESSEQIINEIIAGCSKNEFEVIADREQAIKSVIMRAKKGDCILVAGKGHENYQEIEGVKHIFSDQDIVKQALLELG